MNIFSPDQLAKVIQDTLPADAPTGKNVIVGTVDQHGAQVVASFTMKEKWELQAAARHDWDTGANSVGGRVAVKW